MKLITNLFNKYSKSKEKLKRQSNLQKLASLPYSSFVINEENQKKSGVVLNNKNACPGYNLFLSRYSRKISLINMDGEIAYKWKPALSLRRFFPPLPTIWEYRKIDREGNLLIIAVGKKLVKLDKNSNIIWKIKGGFHHEIELLDNGSMFVLERKKEIVKFENEKKSIWNDYLVLISNEGKIIKKVSVYKLFNKELTKKSFERAFSIYKKRWQDRTRLKLGIKTFLDPFHTNTIKIIKKDIEGIAKKGDILVCFCYINLIAIINFEKEKVLWTWEEGKKILDGPHYPIQLENGNILIYDNGRDRNWSKILELNIPSNKIVWQYGSSDKNNEEYFSSIWGGTCQELENGNILITDSDHGHAFEITKEKKKVWEFFNFEFNILKKRKTIYRLERYPLSTLNLIKTS